MIFSVLYYLAGGLITTMASLLNLIPFGSWPDEFLQGIEYFGEKILVFNFIFPAYEFLMLTGVIVFFFSSYYFTVLLMGVFNFFRGSGEIKI